MASAKMRRFNGRGAWCEPKILFDEDAERSVLGAVLADAAMYPRLAPLLRASDFYRRAHRAIWEAVEGVAAEGGTPDEFTVGAWLERRGRLAEAGGMEGITPLSTGVPPNYPYAATGWVGILHQHVESRTLYALSEAYAQASQYPLDAAPRAEIARQQERLDEIGRRIRGEGRVESSAKLLNFVSMAEVEVESIRWLWDGRLALGKLTMLDGDPGLGKSLMTVDLAARVAMGQRMPDGSPGLGEPGSVVFVSGEDSYADTVKPRLLAAGVSPEAMWRIEGLDLARERRSDGTTSERMFSLVTDLPELEERITRMGARLLIVDPITAYLGSGTDMYKDADLRRVLTPLAMMAEHTGVAVLLVRHLNKSTSTPALHRGLGGVGFIGVARLGLLVAPNPDTDGEVLVSRHKGNIGARPPTMAYRIVQVGEAENMPRVSWVGERETTAEDALVAQAGGGVDRETRADTLDATTWLRAFLASGPRAADDGINEALAAGIITDKRNDKPLRTARRRLGVTIDAGTVYREGGIAGVGRWMWRLSDTSSNHNEGDDVRASTYEAHHHHEGRLSQNSHAEQASGPEFKGTAPKTPRAKTDGRLSGQHPPKTPLTPNNGHLSSDADFNGIGGVLEASSSPKTPSLQAEDVLAFDNHVCRVTGGNHIYAMMRTADGRHVCTECQEPSVPADA